MTFNGNWQRQSGEERTEEYRTWRTTLGVGAVCDIDQIEYNYQTGKPIMIIEICVADLQDEDHPGGVREDSQPSPRFFDAIEAGKLSPDRPQGRLLRYMAQTFNVPLLRLVYVKGRFDRVWLWSDKVPVRECSLVQ